MDDKKFETFVFFCCASFSGITTASFFNGRVGQLLYIGKYTSAILAGILCLVLFLALRRIMQLSHDKDISIQKISLIIVCYGGALAIISTVTSAAFIAREDLISDVLLSRINAAQESFTKEVRNTMIAVLDNQLVESQALSAQLREEQEYAYRGADGRMKRGTGEIEGVFGKAADRVDRFIENTGSWKEAVQSRFKELSGNVDQLFRVEILGDQHMTPIEKISAFQGHGAACNTEMNLFFDTSRNMGLTRMMEELAADVKMQLRNPALSTGQRAYLVDVATKKLPIWGERTERVRYVIEDLLKKGEERNIAYFNVTRPDLYERTLESFGKKYQLPYAIAIFLDFMPLMLIILKKLQDTWHRNAARLKSVSESVSHHKTAG